MEEHRPTVEYADASERQREPKRGSRVAKASWAVAAVVVAGLLVGSLAFQSAVQGASDTTDPTAIPIPISSAERTSGADRGTQRRPLTARVTPTPTPSASPSSATPSDEASSPSVSTATSPSETASPAASASDPEPKAAPSSSEVTPSATRSTPAVPSLGEVVGKQWTTATVNVRRGPGVDFTTLVALAPGRQVQVTNVVVDGRWQQVLVDGRPGFISNKYLGEKAEVPTQSASPKRERGIAQEPCKATVRGEKGLTERAVDVLRAVCNEFPNVTSFGGWRNDADSYHSQGRAIDAMISGEAGWEVANWARKNASKLGITEVIYAQKIWTSQRASDGWRSMSDRGSDTANHYDHVHITVR